MLQNTVTLLHTVECGLMATAFGTPPTPPLSCRLKRMEALPIVYKVYIKFNFGAFLRESRARSERVANVVHCTIDGVDNLSLYARALLGRPSDSISTERKKQRATTYQTEFFLRSYLGNIFYLKFFLDGDS